MFISLIKTSQVGILERFGKFKRILHPGLNFYIPFVDRLVARLPTNVRQDNFKFKVKTNDNVFAQLNVSIQHKIDENKIFEAYYSMAQPVNQMNAYIEDTIRSAAPKLTLDELFESKDDISNAVNTTLFGKMKDYGINIIQSLVTDIDPDEKVKSAMNEINAAKRLKEAACQNAEADKIAIVKRAEAEAERKKLQGEGIAAHRLAVMAGYQTAIQQYSQQGINPQESIAMSLAIQYFDALETIGSNPSTKTLFLPHQPNSIKDMTSQIRNGILQTGLFESEINAKL